MNDFITNLPKQQDNKNWDQRWIKLHIYLSIASRKKQKASSFLISPWNLSTNRDRTTGRATWARYFAFFSYNWTLGCPTLSLSARERLHVHAYRLRVLFATRFSTSHTLLASLVRSSRANPWPRSGKFSWLFLLTKSKSLRLPHSSPSPPMLARTAIHAYNSQRNCRLPMEASRTRGLKVSMESEDWSWAREFVQIVGCTNLPGQRGILLWEFGLRSMIVLGKFFEFNWQTVLIVWQLCSLGLMGIDDFVFLITYY